MFVDHEIAANEKLWHNEMSGELKRHIYDIVVRKSEGM